MMSAVRERLPNRRASQQFTFTCNDQRYVATVSFFPDGRLAEIFIGNAKGGSHSDSAAKDSAVVCSIALQYGVSVDVIQHALLRDARGVASSVLGAALDLFVESRSVSVGKHETGFARVARDFYPTPPWCIEALAEHVELAGLSVWEPAAGNGSMVEALKAAGATVYATDVHDYGYGLDAVIDFTTSRRPRRRFDALITNPPFGLRAKLAERFVEVGLQHIAGGDGFLALLLPTDFDAAKTRTRFFAGCPHFAGRIILNRRIVWFANPDKREAPKENHGWFIWSRSVLRGRQPVTLYAPHSVNEAETSPAILPGNS